MKIIIATSNEHKVREIRAIAPDIEWLSASEAGLKSDAIENGKDFFQNAKIKAEYVYQQCGLPVLADDSGLCVDALNGEPGIFSARYGEKGKKVTFTDKERYELLLKKMEGIQGREAQFVCCLYLILEDKRIFTFQEVFKGEITQSPSGEDGFGYDPVFYIPTLGKTAAQLAPELKNRLSHRGKALSAALNLIRYLNQE